MSATSSALVADLPIPVAEVDLSTGGLVHRPAPVEPCHLFKVPAGWPA